ncbi:MAG: hypothetical protein R3E09_08740 [Novosphingobium sp.]
MFEENKKVVQDWLDAVSGNEDQVWSSYLMMDNNAAWTLIGTTPASGRHETLKDIKDVFQHACWHGDGRPGSYDQGLDPSYGVKPLKILEVTALEDGRVLVHCTSDCRGNNGVAYKNEYCWIIKVERGKIVDLYEFADTALIERALFNKQIVPAEDYDKLAAQ